MAAETTLDDYYPVEYPRNRCVLELKSYDADAGSIEIVFPSWSESGRKHICHYFLKEKARDFCTCDGNEKYKKRCWHMAWRPIILKAFLNKPLGDDMSWLENIEIYGAHTVGKIMEYIEALLNFQDEVWQKDLLDLELIDYQGQPVDRRRIGVAFQKLFHAGDIEPVRQAAAQYAKRKGGKVYIWRTAIRHECHPSPSSRTSPDGRGMGDGKKVL